MANPGFKGRLANVTNLAKVLFHIGFMPAVIYLGLTKGAEPGMPELSILSILWQ